MKHFSKYIYSAIATALSFGAVSCTDYLDKAPEVDLSEKDAFSDFRSFQGYTEEIYSCIPDFCKRYWTNSWNWGEDEIMNVGIDYHMTYKVDNGDFWGWQSEHDGWNAGWLDKGDFNPRGDRFAKGLWPGAWYGIRKANMGLDNLDMLTDATTEQRNFVEGQLYFFRGWFHFQLMQYFGGLPYIDTVLENDFRLPRLSYSECAEKAAADLRKAADLLPINWDKTTTGNPTLGNNDLRINKIMALGYLGKCLLWAGSPLMNEESTGSATYNQDYCNRAAEVFGEMLTLIESGQTQYSMVTFSEMPEIFYTKGKSGLMPGLTEAIFRCPSDAGWGAAVWGQAKCYSPSAINGDGGVLFLPTANYVNYYGMANGLPLDDPDSGFDPTHPFKGRDPRFYVDIAYDGVRIVRSDSKEADGCRYASLATDGTMRSVTTDSRTGYLLLKFTGVGINDYDQDQGWSPQYNLAVPWMRIPDVYLMYAEAIANAKGVPTAKSSNFSKTAIEAVNVVRERVGVDPLNAKYTGSLDGFMSELRRERAVELSFEGHRFNDLRRWKLLDKSPYNIKTSQEFTRDPGFNPATDDASEARVIGWSEKEILTRNFTSKHYWLPLKVSDVTIYPEFYQNPGW